MSAGKSNTGRPPLEEGGSPHAAPAKTFPRLLAAPEPMSYGERQVHALILLISAAVLAGAEIVQVGEGDDQANVSVAGLHIPSLCMFRQLTGLPCATCGTVRSLVCIAHGQIAASWHFHRFGLLFFALIAVQIPYRAVVLARGVSTRRRSRWLELASIALAVALAINWAITLAKLLR